jgi:hypothetical protein
VAGIPASASCCPGGCCGRRLALHQYGGIPKSNGRIYTTYVNDGVALLRRATSPSQTVLTMDVANPFPYALDRPPALGGIAASRLRPNPIGGISSGGNEPRLSQAGAVEFAALAGFARRPMPPGTPWLSPGEWKRPRFR